jgi:sulfur-oxidizing protein SoxY
MNAVRRWMSRACLRRPAALLCAALGMGSMGSATGATEAAGWERIDPLRELIGASTPVTRGIHLNLPLVSEDGSAVPLEVRVDSPMTAADHVRSIHLFAAGNPTPEVAEFHLQQAAGRAELSTRVRLNESQTVYAVALMSDGEVRLAAREVRVTVSGCLGRPQVSGSAFETPRIGLPRDTRAGEPAEVRSLIDHPMETGLRPDGRGGFLPEHIVEHFSASLDGVPVLEARLHRAIAMNPFLRFHVRAAPGDLTLEWRDDRGRTARASARLQPR